MNIILLFLLPILFLFPYAYADELDRLSFGECSVAHMKQNTGSWKSQNEKKQFLFLYVGWHIICCVVLLGALYYVLL